MKLIKSNLGVLLATSLLTISAPLSGAVLVDLDTPFVFAEPSNLIPYSGIIINNEVEPVHLNGYEVLIEPAFLVDDTGLFFLLPAMLPGGEFLAGGFFTLQVPVGVVSGLYSGQLRLFGGPTTEDGDLMGLADFQLYISDTASSDVPEPLNVVVMIPSLLAMFSLSLRRAGRPGA